MMQKKQDRPQLLRLLQRAKRIRCLVTDVDGVLTDGAISYGGGTPDGMRTFNALDGQGIALAKRAGILVFWVSGKRAKGVAARANELGVPGYFGLGEKVTTYEQIKSDHGLADGEIAYIGDDWNDLPVLFRSGFSVSVPNGHPEVKRRVHYITKRAGGHGAVREVIELILRAQGRYQELLNAFLK